jgi:SynChlorMet cassette radical SAM/SPASM protein ScmF
MISYANCKPRDLLGKWSMGNEAVDLKAESSEKLVERKWDLPEGVPPLFTFYLYLTNGCNLACRHCWITPTFVNGEPSPGDCLDLDLLKLAVSEGKKLGLSNAKLTGGEPVLHPRFVEIVDYLSAEEIKLNMETNGTLIDADLAKHLKNNTTMWHISVSLDSAEPDKHDQFRGVKGAFKAVVKGTEHLVQAGFRPQVIMCPHRGNLHEVEDLVKLAVSLGAGSVKFNPVTATGRGKTMEQHGETLDFDETMHLVRSIRGEMQDRTSIPLLISIPPALATTKEILREKRAGGECWVHHILGILGDGAIALCGIGRSIPELCFGRLGKERLRDIWISHHTLLKLRNDLNDEFPGICGDCIHSRRCLTQCVANNYVRTGNLVNPDFLCEEADRREIFPISRRRSFKKNLNAHAC